MGFSHFGTHTYILYIKSCHVFAAFYSTKRLPQDSVHFQEILIEKFQTGKSGIVLKPLKMHVFLLAS